MKKISSILMRNEPLQKMCRVDRKWGYRLYWVWYDNRFYRRLFRRKGNQYCHQFPPHFEKLKDFPNYDLILVGGRYRVKTQTFVGQFANKLLKEIKVSKAFIGVNGIDGHHVSTANEEEGNGNAIILNNAIEKYVVADNSKFDSYSFYSFYRVEDLNAIITDDSIPKKIKDKYGLYTKII